MFYVNQANMANWINCLTNHNQYRITLCWMNILANLYYISNNKSNYSIPCHQQPNTLTNKAIFLTLLFSLIWMNAWNFTADSGMLECVTGWLSMRSMQEECDLLHPMLSNSYSWLVVFIKYLSKSEIIQGVHWSMLKSLTITQTWIRKTAHCACVFSSGFFCRSYCLRVGKIDFSNLTRNVATTTRRFL